MFQAKRLARAGGLVLGLALFNYFTSLSPGYVPPVSLSPLIAGQQEDVRIGADGSIILRANAPPAPEIYGPFEHFGIYISPSYQFNSAFNTLTITYHAAVPRGADTRVDVRSSKDGTRWSLWEVGLRSGEHANFDTPARFASPSAVSTQAVMLRSLSQRLHQLQPPSYCWRPSSAATSRSSSARVAPL